MGGTCNSVSNGPLSRLAAPVGNQPEQDAENEAHHKASDNREVHGRVFAAMNNVARKAAEAEWQPATDKKQPANNGQNNTEDHECPAELTHRVHSHSVDQSDGRGV